jgi:hypothetical protein
LAPEWIVGDWGTGNSVNSIVSGAFTCKITSIGAAAWNVFFYHFEDIKLTAGVNYIYKFTSHATAASSITTQIKTVGTATTIVPWLSENAVAIGLTDSTYSWPFSPTADDDSAQVNFQLGFGNVPLGETIYISHVSIQADQTPVVSKPNAASAKSFSQMTRNGVSVNLVRPDKAAMKLYDLRGVQVADYSSMLRSMSPGSHQINFGTRTVSNGTYVLAVNNGARVQCATVTLEK